MSRSIWKIPFTYKNCSDGNFNTTIKQQKIWSRSSMILPLHLSKEFLVHNGKNWISVKSTDEMVGHKFGEFSSTRRKTAHNFEKKKYNSVSLRSKLATGKQSSGKKALK